MPISEERMSPLVKRLRREMRERGYAALAGQVPTEQVLFAHAAATGVAVAELMRLWAGVPEAPPRKRTMPQRRGDDDQPLPGDDDDQPTPLDDGDEIGPLDDEDEDDEEKRSLYEFEEE